MSSFFLHHKLKIIFKMWTMDRCWPASFSSTIPSSMFKIERKNQIFVTIQRIWQKRFYNMPRLTLIFCFYTCNAIKLGSLTGSLSENCVLLDFYAASSGNALTTFRDRIVNDDQQDANILVYLFIPNQFYMFRAMSWPIIRTN